MARTVTVEDYAHRWQAAVEHEREGDIPFDADVTTESVVIFESARSTPMGEGMTALPDFGDAICFYRYFRIPRELGFAAQAMSRMDPEFAAMLPGLEMMQASWEQRRPKLTTEQLREREARATLALDALLEEFVRDGYCPGMEERLIQGANAGLLDFELHKVYVLPRDLPELLRVVGNPFANYDAYRGAEEAEANAPAFDFNNAEHRAALKESIQMVGR